LNFAILGSCSFEESALLLVKTLTEGKLDYEASVILKDQIKEVHFKRSNPDTEENDEDWLFDPTIYDTPIIETSSGLVMGQTNNCAHTFYNIPYAEPPVGELRWKYPSEASYRDEMINSTFNDERKCFQSGSDTKNTEDCLVLTINTPSGLQHYLEGNKISGDYPVLVWFHGGAFSFGAGNVALYEARMLANITNTIVVSVNYRLSSLGFLAYEENGERIEGNMGLKDQQLALQWIQKNIGNFGGNKDSVTLFGQSAGAQSIMFHLLSTISEPLFHRAIMESNPAVYNYLTFDEAVQITEKHLQLIDCSGYTTNMECLKNVPASELCSHTLPLRLGAMVNGDPLSLMELYRPILDGREFTDQPLNLFRRGEWQHHKPVIMGSNTDELYYITSIFNGLGVPMTYNLYVGYVEAFYGEQLLHNTVEFYQDFYDIKKPTLYNYAELAGQQFTDAFFTCPLRLLSRYAADTSTSNVYLYVFGHPVVKPHCYSNRTRDFLPCGKAEHTAEIPFVFKTGPHIGYTFNEDEYTISDIMTDYWGTFAHYGTPSSDTYYDWPPYSTQEDISLRIGELVDGDSYQQQYFRKDICDYWDSTEMYLYPTVDFGPTPTTETHDTTTVTMATSHVATTVSLTTSDGISDDELSTPGSGSWNLLPSVLLLFTCLLVTLYP